MPTGMTASGWYPSNILVIKSWRPWGPNAMRQALVQMQVEATNFGGGADTYPTEGIPAPEPSKVGFRECIEYIIPLGPFTRVSGPGAPSLPAKAIPWGCEPPTFGASGGGTDITCRLKLFCVRFSTAVSVGAGAEATYTGQAEFPSAYTASSIFSTDTMKAYGIFVGK